MPNSSLNAQLEMPLAAPAAIASLANLSNEQLLNQLATWVNLGALSQLDLAFARFLSQEDPSANPYVLLTAALVSQRTSQGHVCLSLAEVLHQPESYLTEDEFLAQQAPAQPLNLIAPLTAGQQLAQLLKGLSLETWLTHLTASSALLTASATSQLEAINSPLVLTTRPQPLVYLRRYWAYEQQILRALQPRLEHNFQLDVTATQEILTQLFQLTPQQLSQGWQEPQPNWQKLACALAAAASFSIITGGPGTGKTTTVVRLLALLQGLQIKAGQAPLTIRLAAPTGKAAARLKESLTGSLEELNLPEDLAAVKQLIPTQVTTLHRLLGSQAKSREFRHNANNPLIADLLVVDEASMVDIEMLAKLLAALSPNCRLILLGDKDQLASVEAGSLLGDLCLTADAGNYTPATASWLAQATGQQLTDEFINPQGSPLAQVTSKLRLSYRFAAYPGIGKLAEAVNSGQASLSQLQAIFAAYPLYPEQPTDEQQIAANKASLNFIQLEKASQPNFLAPLKQLIKAGYSRYLSLVFDEQPASNHPEEMANWAKKVFAAHQSFQLLTAVRKGTFGVEALNQLALASLKEMPQFNGRLATSNSHWYNGRPVLVTRNDYSLKLMNGDLGICLAEPNQKANQPPVLRVAFADGKGGIRWVLPSRLQEVETVFAMTVHKSQGSEFTHTALVLPATDNPVLTKELLYTAITRSSQAFTLVSANPEVLAASLKKQIVRASGLQQI